jgi:hypothetical protein
MQWYEQRAVRSSFTARTDHALEERFHLIRYRPVVWRRLALDLARLAGRDDGGRDRWAILSRFPGPLGAVGMGDDDWRLGHAGTGAAR